MTCPEALALLDNPKQQNHVFNPNAIRAQCDPNTRLECCKGNANLGAALCGPFFGPTNFIGNCDSIMQSFCTTNPADPLCGCLKSDLPNPECIDVRCRNTNAMKLSNQLNNQCLGTFITCQQVRIFSMYICILITIVSFLRSLPKREITWLMEILLLKLVTQIR